eukprot:PhM_4_TR2120/c1_g1_i6/m.3162
MTSPMSATDCHLTVQALAGMAQSGDRVAGAPCPECGNPVTKHEDQVVKSAKAQALKKRDRSNFEGDQLDATHPFAKFVADLSAATVTGGVIKLAATDPMLPTVVGRGILVRTAYVDVLSTIQGAKPHARLLVTGTPGIGKSTLRTYLLWAWLKGMLLQFDTVDYDITADGESSILIHREADGSLSMLSHRKREWVADVTKTLGLYELCRYDAESQCAAVAFAVFSASPGAKGTHGNHLDKKTGYRKIVLPLWDLNELQTVDPDLDSARFDMYGGVPRLVLELTPSEADAYVQEALKSLSDEVVSGVRQSDNHRPKHRILVIGAEGATDFISRHVCHCMMDIVRHNTLQEAKHWSLMMSPTKMGGSVRGQMFEAYFHLTFSSNQVQLTYGGATFSCLKMRECTPAELSNPTTGTYDQVGTLYVPFARNNPTWDSYFVSNTVPPKLVFLQLTVGSEHRSGKWCDLHRVANLVQATHGKLEVLLLYVVPKNSEMTTAPGFDTEGFPTTKYTSFQVDIAKTDFDF